LLVKWKAGLIATNRNGTQALSMREFGKLRVVVLLCVAIWLANSAAAATIKIDYDTFSSPFFNAGTTQANQAKAALNAAAAYYSSVLTDTLDAISPQTYSSPRVNISWSWTMQFSNPNGAGTRSLTNQVIPADEVRVFAGAQAFTGSTLAQGGIGSQGWSRPGIPGSANSTDYDAIDAIDVAFDAAVMRRGEPVGDFARWGGSLSFDRDANWHFLHTTAPPPGKTDFYSVALHELGHVLGFGGAPEFVDLAKPGGFDGSASKATYGGPVPMTSDKGHWAEGTQSTVYGTGTQQTAIMVPSFPPATRRLVTTLDAAALTDIGWSVVEPPTPPGDYNRDGVVNAADYVVWRNTRGQNVPAGTGADGDGNSFIGNGDYTFWRARFGNTLGGASGAALANSGSTVPEPAGLLLAIVAVTAALCSRDRRRG
jgi:hypothetical protein